MTVFIWGMGLLGASLGLRLKEAGHTVLGSVRSAKSRDVLLSHGFENIFTNENQCLTALADCEALILGVNLSDCYGILKKIFLLPSSKDIFVMDLSSTKREICDFVAQINPTAHFIGAHPMAGKEKHGPEMADVRLFENCSVFLTPLKNHDAALTQELLNKAQAMWSACGARTVQIDAATHDHTMAYVSHGLHLTACLMAAMSNEVYDKNLPVSPVAGSYRDMTRIVDSSPFMWQDIILSNRDNSVEWLTKLAANATALANDLKNDNSDIVKLFSAAQATRALFMRT